jgi:hypothetical protein
VGILGGLSIVKNGRHTDYEIAVNSVANKLPISDSNMMGAGA